MGYFAITAKAFAFTMVTGLVIAVVFGARSPDIHESVRASPLDVPPFVECGCGPPDGDHGETSSGSGDMGESGRIASPSAALLEEVEAAAARLVSSCAKPAAPFMAAEEADGGGAAAAPSPTLSPPGGTSDGSYDHVSSVGWEQVPPPVTATAPRAAPASVPARTSGVSLQLPKLRLGGLDQ